MPVSKQKFERWFYMIMTWWSCNKLHKIDRERNSVKDECLKKSVRHSLNCLLKTTGWGVFDGRS